jgi:hypothetical protein
MTLEKGQLIPVTLYKELIYTMNAWQQILGQPLFCLSKSLNLKI